MTAPARILAIALVALALQAPAAWAQPVVPVHAQQESGAFSAAELDQLLAPIALYPDVMLSTILIASTYPLEIVQAARWSRNNPQLSGEAAVAATAGQDWDPAVRALVAFPEILQRLDEDLDWTQALGDAFLYQEAQVMDSVQYLRQRAADAGNLQTDENVRVVRTERTLVIEPVRERIVYVPWYDTRVVYGPWWRPAHPPVYWHAPHWYAPVHYRPRHSGIYWSSGFAVSSGFFFSTVHWPQRHVLVLHRPHHFYAPHRRPHTQVHHHHYYAYTPGTRWQHTPHHRRGVAYRHPEVHRRYQPEHREPRREGRHSYVPQQREQRLDAPRRGDQPVARNSWASGTRPERLASPGTGQSSSQAEARSRYLEGVPRMGEAAGRGSARTLTGAAPQPGRGASAPASQDTGSGQIAQGQAARARDMPRSALVGESRDRVQRTDGGQRGSSPRMSAPPATTAPPMTTSPAGRGRSAAPSASTPAAPATTAQPPNAPRNARGASGHQGQAQGASAASRSEAAAPTPPPGRRESTQPQASGQRLGAPARTADSPGRDSGRDSGRGSERRMR
jgi:hypothetical protein